MRTTFTSCLVIKLLEDINILKKASAVEFKPIDWEFEEKVRQRIVREWYRHGIKLPAPVGVYSGVLFPNYRVKTTEGK